MNDAANKLIEAAHHDEELRDTLLMLGALSLLYREIGNVEEADEADDIWDAEEEVGDLVANFQPDERFCRLARSLITEWLEKQNEEEHG